jgi:ABC-type dipeptide/oligopeptide/nickel transport system permease component
MFRYIIRPLLFAIPILLISSMLVFLVVRSTIDPVAG